MLLRADSSSVLDAQRRGNVRGAERAELHAQCLLARISHAHGDLVCMRERGDAYAFALQPLLPV
jgi:hypothetical protein